MQTGPQTATAALHSQTLSTIPPSTGQNKRYGNILLYETSMFVVKMANYDGNHRYFVEKNVPIALILPSRWQDSAESLGIEHQLFMTERYGRISATDLLATGSCRQQCDQMLEVLKVAYFLPKLPKQQQKHFYIKEEVFKIAQKGAQNFGIILIEKMLPRLFKSSSPIWSLWSSLLCHTPSLFSSISSFDLFRVIT